MHAKSHSPCGGFTLVELLTVLAVIGILAAILVPTASKIRESARRTVDASNLRQLAQAAALYAADHRDRLPDPGSPTAPEGGTAVHQWAGLLAATGVLTDASIFFSAADPLLSADPPSTILDPDDASRLASTFAALAPSFEFIGGVRLTDPAHTPIAFTRGLQPDGAWAAADANDDATVRGVYASGGGHIAFLGGHVRFYRRINGDLIDRDGRPTSDIRQAIPPGARIYGMFSAVGAETAD